MPPFGTQQPRYGTTGYRTSQPATTGIMRELSGLPLYGQMQPDQDPTGRYSPLTNLGQPATPKQPTSTSKPPPAGQQPGQGTAASVEPADADPVLARVKKLYGYIDENGNFVPGVRVQDARADAGAKRKQLAVDVGDYDFARQLNLDEPTAVAARDNPFSILAELARSLDQRGRGETAGFRESNLLQSGARARALGDLEHDRLRDTNQTFRQAGGLLDEIARYLLGTEQDALDQIFAAERDAFNQNKDRPPLVDPLDNEGNLVDLGIPGITSEVLAGGGPAIDSLLEELLGNVDAPVNYTPTQRRPGGWFQAL